MAKPKLTLRDKLIARLTELCENKTATTMIVSRKDLKELFGDRPDDMEAIVHHTDGGGDLFARVHREYLLDRLQKLAAPVAPEKPKPLTAVPSHQPFIPQKSNLEAESKPTGTP